MKPIELWDRLMESNEYKVDKGGKNRIIPTKSIKIKGYAVKYLTNNDGKVDIYTEKIEKIKHEGENIDYSVYGTPIESTTYKFAKCLKKRFGNDVFIKLDDKDRDYITNSYHVWVEEPIDPFEKIRIESKFQALSPGGAISYIETADLTKNIDSILEVIKYIYDNIVYAELNTKSDYCQVCGSTDELDIVDKDGELLFQCKHCGNNNQKKLNYARRVCGYLSTNEMNTGRMDEIRSRYVHLDNHECT